MSIVCPVPLDAPMIGLCGGKDAWCTAHDGTGVPISTGNGYDCASPVRKEGVSRREVQVIRLFCRLLPQRNVQQHFHHASRKPMPRRPGLQGCRLWSTRLLQCARKVWRVRRDVHSRRREGKQVYTSVRVWYVACPSVDTRFTFR